MFIAILTLISALSISGVAIYYSVAGLAAIFAAAVIPIIVMGVVLEVGKLVTAVWLHYNWNIAKWWLKTYLSIAVVVLMFITSMGIFGFLSKAHVEQTSLTLDQAAQIETINGKLDRSAAKVDRWQEEINRLLKGEDVRVDSLVEKEQIELDKIYTKIKSEKDDVRADADKQIALQQDRLKQAADRKTADISAAQERFKNAFSKRKLDDAIESAKANEIAVAAKAQKEIIRIQEWLAVELKAVDDKYAGSVSEIQERINGLRNQANQKTDDIESKIVTLETQVDNEQKIIDEAREQKAIFEKDYRKLEAEVGPIKYIAEFVYGQQANQDLLEAAVRWVIIVIIFVFDPLAVLLLIAANQSLVRRIPPSKPQDLVDLERPDPDDLPPSSPTKLTEQPNTDSDISDWNKMIDEATANLEKEKLLKQEQEWKEKLKKFNENVEKPEDKPLEIIVDEADTMLTKTSDQKKNVDGFDPDEVEYEMQDIKIEEFKEREKQEIEKLEQVAKEAREEQVEAELDEAPVSDIDVVDNSLEMLEEIEPLGEKTISDEPQPERIIPNLTEVIEPEIDINKPKNSKPLALRTLSVPIESTDKLVDKEEEEEVPPTPEELKVMRDKENKNRFIIASGITEEDAKNHPPLTKSRMSFFEDHIDDILRGDATIENLPPEVVKTCAVLMSEFDNPPIIEPQPKSIIGVDKGVEKMTPEQLAEKFQVSPDLEDRDITDDELDKLLQGTLDDAPLGPAGGKTQIIIKNGKKIRVPVDESLYVQNEEQTKDTAQWKKIKELDLPEPEKNELSLPSITPTDDEIIDKVEETADETVEIAPEHSISPGKIDAFRKRLLSDADYQKKIEARINNLITKIENKELKIEDLTDTDRTAIIRIINELDKEE